MSRILLDTGPLVAFLNRRDEHHRWTREVLEGIRPPLLTCEPVLSEACFLVRRLEGGQQAVLNLAERGIVKIAFTLDAEVDAVQRLLKRYAEVPMSLADACLVRMTELDRDTKVLTLDTDFRVYRRNRRQVVPVIMLPT